MTAARAEACDCPVRWDWAFACLHRTTCAISFTVCSARTWTFFTFCLLLVRGHRNIVVTPARTFRISGFIVRVLLCLLSGVVEPGVDELVWQPAFALSDVVDEGAEVGAAPTTGGRCAGSAKGHLLAAVALETNGGRMPLVDSSERHLAALVVGLDAFEDLHHRLFPLSSAVCSAGRSCRVAL